MTETKCLDSLPHWLPSLCAIVHRWEMVHGSLEGIGETSQWVKEQFKLGRPTGIDFKDVPDFVLRIGPEVVKVEVVDGTNMEIRRWSARTKSRKHHRVPQMLISRWGSGDGRVVWRRSNWEAGRFVRIKAKKVMRESDAYTINFGLDPDLVEDLLAMLEGGVAEILRAIDDTLARPADGRPIKWTGHLANAQPILKLFIAHQLIRTWNGRKRVERAVPFEDYIKEVAGSDNVSKEEMPLLRESYEMWVKTMSSIVDPYSPLYQWVTGPESEVCIGLPEPLDDVFPLTDDPVATFPFPNGLTDASSRPWWESVLLFLPVSPRAGIGIMPARAPGNVVKWASISAKMVALWCAELDARHSEVVLPSKKTWVWDVFNARENT